MQRLSSLYSDNRIALMRYHINTIFKNCFNIDDAVVSQKFCEPLEAEMFRLIDNDETLRRFDKLEPLQFEFKPEEWSNEMSEE